MNGSETRNRPPNARRLRSLVAGLVVLLALLLATRYLRQTEARIEPPEIDTTGLSARAVGEIQAARDKIAQSPQSADAWGKLGMILVARQLEPQAHACFRRAHELAPKEFLWPYLLGVSLAVSDPPQAVNSLRAAVAIRDDVAVAQVRLGELHLELNHYSGARNHLLAALDLSPQDLHALIAVARLELAENNLAAAQQVLDTARELAPQVRAVHEIQAQLYQRKGDRLAALQELEAAASLPDIPLPYDDPFASQVMALRGDPQQDLTRARQLLASARFLDAIQLLRDAWREQPTEPLLPCELARAYAQVNEFDMAHSVLELAAEKHPESAQVFLQRGVLYFLQSDYESAARFFGHAADRKPDYVEAHFYLGKSLEKLGRIEEALAAFGAAVRLQPTHVEARADLDRLFREQTNEK